MNVTIVKGGSIFMSRVDLEKMFRLRFRMFRERLGWDVDCDDGQEHDGFDALDPLYVLAKEGTSVVGCWRMLPTTGAEHVARHVSLAAGRTARACR